MQTPKFIYILRACIQPGHYEEKRLDTLISFCRQACIDDVMFFIDCEDLNQGHITSDEVKLWLQLIARAGEQLTPLGITTSVNPWTTLNHADRGRTLKEGQKFQLMEDPCGTQSTVCACPLSKEWRKYITDIYSMYASIHPYMLWIEDDFRFHNHAPLQWGGCFCDLHMEEYSKRAGKKLTREEFIQGILQPGEPHPYRKIWLDICRETLVNVAQEIGEAVHKVSPNTRLGLMSSIPEVHCAEGRDWEGILKGLATDTPMVNRPHLPSYQEIGPQSYFWYFNTISVMSKALVPASTEIYPEVENSPRTLFAKSRNFTRFQIESSAVLGSQGITLNLFNVMGSGVLPKEGFQRMLAETKPFMDKIAELNIGKGKREGIKVLFSPLSSYTLYTSKGEKMEELYPVENFWAGLLSAYGIANCYSSDKNIENEFIAISGQYFRNLTGQEIFHLFEKNFVLLDGEAAYTLYDMGYGDIAGIGGMKWYKTHSGVQAYEEVCNGIEYCGINNARMSLQRAEGGYYKIDYIKEPYLITQAKSPNGEIAGPGMCIIDNKIFILPCGGKDFFFQIHLNTYKQAILQSVICGELQSYMQDSAQINTGSFNKPVYAEQEPYVGVYVYDYSGSKVILLVNGSGDDLENLKVHVPEAFQANCHKGHDDYKPHEPHESSKSHEFYDVDVYEISRNDVQEKEIPFNYKPGEIIIETTLDRFEVKAFILKART
ncbi:MAG TPA: hypothetical protein PK733_06290 [Clostridiales bacterium]|nr:hypothetical protein [Clostridiales bacterium]